MRTIVVGLGIQGNKRKKFAGGDFQFSIDPHNVNADFKNLNEINFSLFDSALLCLPDEIKYDYVKTLILNGKSVLVEKPFNLSVLQTNELKNIISSNGATIYVAYNHRFEPHWIAAKSLISKKRIGNIYKLNLFYGNGTAALVKNSEWRDRGLGVIPDLASHLFDLVDFWLGLEGYDVEIISANNFENASYDNAVIKLKGKPEVILEVSLLSWKNSFKAELFGSEGSIILDSLCKWGATKLIIRDRRIPSGIPVEEITTLVCPDPTWEAEYLYFKALVSKGDLGNLDENLRISQVFERLEKNI